MTRPDRITITVSEDADVVLAGRQAKTLLGGLDFDEPTVEEVVLVVHELASNIVKHAGDGEIELAPLPEDPGGAIEIRASDSGPGIADVDRAVVDGYSTVGSLGAGLGAVHRLMDDVVISSDGDAESGAEIVATRRDSTAVADEPAPPVDVDAATRPQPGYDLNGDAFLVEHGPAESLVGVIDGLGHGPEAHRAASTAQQHVRAHSTQPLADLFAGVDRACRDTRGVVMLLARFDWDAREVRLGSVGNVTVKVCESPDPLHLVPQRGVLGGNAPSPTIDRWDLHPALAIVVHTDGLATSWSCDDFAWRAGDSATPTADELLRRFAKPDDDATVLVVRGVGR